MESGGGRRQRSCAPAAVRGGSGAASSSSPSSPFPRAVKAGGSPGCGGGVANSRVMEFSPPPRSWAWPLSDDEPYCCSHHDNAVITAVELRRTGGTGALVLRAPSPGSSKPQRGGRP